MALKDYGKARIPSTHLLASTRSDPHSMSYNSRTEKDIFKFPKLLRQNITFAITLDKSVNILRVTQAEILRGRIFSTF